MFKLKKMLTGILSAVMLVTCSMSAMATEAVGTAQTYSIEVTNKDAGHIYEVYQIFTGDLSVNESNQKVLSNVEFGTGVDPAKLTSLGEDAAAVAKAISEAQDTKALQPALYEALTTVYGTLTQSETVNSESLYTYSISGLPAGYYLVKDKDDSLGDADTAYTTMILQVVGDVSVKAKSDSPEVIKKVVEETYTQDNGFGTGYNDVADYDIGDTIPFELIGSVIPKATVDTYDTYAYEFHDTQSEGLTFDPDSVKVYVAVDGTISDSMAELGSDLYNVTLEGNNLTVTMDIKAEGIYSLLTDSSRMVVRYTSKLNAEAVIGLPGNPNEVYLQYSNNPYDNTSKGKTPTDKVIVFTFELDTLKYDGSSADLTKPDPLKGAEFKLLKKNNAGNLTDVATFADGKLIAFVTPELAEDGTITNGDVLVSGDDGYFVLAGLDEGTYYLREVKAPEGFNLLTTDVKIVVDANCVNTQDWDGTPENALTGFADQVEGIKQNLENGKGVEVWVENNRGAVLPSTGGVGTTIFYVVGGVLIVAAIAFFVLRRKNQE